MKIQFSATAREDLTQIVRYISHDKPEAAKKWVKKLRESVEKLADFPQIGRIVPEYKDEHIRELIVGQYRVVYKIDANRKRIVVLTIFHGKRLLNP